jgi:hypothetical protein
MITSLPLGSGFPLMKNYMDCRYLALIKEECQEYVWEIRPGDEAVKTQPQTRASCSEGLRPDKVWRTAKVWPLPQKLVTIAAKCLVKTGTAAGIVVCLSGVAVWGFKGGA